MTDIPAINRCSHCAGHGRLYQCQVSFPCTATYWATFKMFPDGPPPPHTFGEYQRCTSCQGTGWLGPVILHHRCNRCHGTGSVFHVTETIHYVVVSCPRCQGTGCLQQRT